MNQLITTQPFEIAADQYCRHCGRHLAPADNFCGECGNHCRDLIEVGSPVIVGSQPSLPRGEMATTNALTVERVLAIEWL